MTAPMLMTDCPTEETLAAYVDDRLDAATRLKVTEHLASCGDCRELVMLASDFQAEPVPEPGPEPLPEPVSGKFGWFAASGSLAAAAVIAMFLLRGPDMGDLIAASQTGETRPSLGMFADDFTYKKAYSPPRGGVKTTLDGNAELLRIAQKAKDPHVKGMAFLLLSEKNREFYDNAVSELEKAHQNAGPDERDATAIDLATALLTSWAVEEDYQQALKLSDEILARGQNPKARWNRAAALELLRRDDEAIKAWDDYLRLDPNSEWAQEAARRRGELVEFRDVSAPQPPKR